MQYTIIGDKDGSSYLLRVGGSNLATVQKALYEEKNNPRNSEYNNIRIEECDDKEAWW